MKFLIRLLAILVISGGTFAYLAFRCETPVYSQKLHYSPTLALTPGYTVCQDFTVPQKTFSTLSILFTSRTNTVNRGLVRISLQDGDAFIYDQIHSAADFPRDRLYTISFPVQNGASGKTYRLTISGLPSDDFSGGQHVMLIPQDECPDLPPVVVNGNQWAYVCYLVYGSKPSLAESVLIGVGVAIFLLVLWWIETLVRPKQMDMGLNSANPKSLNRGFDRGMHYFRAFAIVFIAIQHFLCLTGYIDWAVAWFQSSPVFFIFISGYLCQYLHDSHPDSTLRYYWKRVSTVIFPYVFWTTVTIAVVWGYGYSRIGVISASEIASGALGKVYLYGGAQVPYWYVPFISVIFLFSPLAVRVSNNTFNVLCFFFTVLMVVAEGSSSLGAAQGVGSLYALYTSSYLYGMAFSRHRATLEPLCRRYAWIALVLCLFIGMSLSFPGVFFLDCPNKPVVTIVQKLLFTIVALFVLQKFSAKKNWLMDQVAKLSFTIYFCHQFFIADFVEIKDLLGTAFPQIADVLFMLVLCIAFLAAVSAFAYVLKLAFGRWSRMFIGA